MIYFWRVMCWLDEQLHRLECYRRLDWLLDTEWRFRFCQWAWCNWADQADTLDAIAERGD